jgi:hypothetical protein
MENAQYKLEVYFAKNYNRLYIKFGGRYINYSEPIFPTPMQLYFSSGEYKELDDPELDLLWKKARKERNTILLISAVLIVSLLVLFSTFS